MKDNVCTICGSNLNILYLNKNPKNSNSVNILKCKNCDHKFQQDYDKEYVDEYYSYYKDLINKNREDIFSYENKISYKKIFRVFENHINKYNLEKSILDVGSGYGELVNYANENKWKATGIELSKDALKIANKYHINIKNLSIEDNYFKDKKYSIITLTEVIEHVDEPNKLILHISNLLSSNGMLYITTPNFNSLDRYIMSSEWKVIHKEHINYFTTQSLKKLISNNNSLVILNINSSNLVLEIYKMKLMKLIFKNFKQNNLTKSNIKLRKKIYSNYFLFIIKNIINYILNFFEIGNNFTIIIKKIDR